jgi:hypothetical protein
MVQVEKIAYAGWPNCYRVSNGQVELIVTTDVGPRVIRYGFPGQKNILYESPADLGKTGGETWRAYGGHRLWHAPEDVVRTYQPDNSPCEVMLFEDGLLVIAPPEKGAGMQKSVEIHMAAEGTKVSLTHRIRNVGLWPVTLSAWAVTVMAANGTAIIPQGLRGEWPKILLPTYSIAMWGYTRMSDPRFTWGDEFILLRQEAIPNREQKIGLINSEGWAAYKLQEQLFVKTFDYFPDLVYPDRNSNFECFTNHDIIEMETLGPIVQIAPGQDAVHREAWQLFKDQAFALTDAEIKKHIPALLNSK